MNKIQHFNDTNLLPLSYKYLPNNRLFETWGDDILVYGNNT
jgi:hypothetical protein